MDIVVVGPGALGCLFAAYWTVQTDDKAGRESGNKVWLLDHDQERARKIDEQGILVERQNTITRYPLSVTDNPGVIGSVDVVMLCVKSYDVAKSLSVIGALFNSETLLITLQNGISHLVTLQSCTKVGSVAVGVTAQGATLLAPGHIRHAGQGLTRIGLLKGLTPTAEAHLKELADIFSACGLAIEIVSDIIPQVWAKLFINVGINALSAIHNCPNGKLLDRPETKDTLKMAVAEAVAVAKAKGVKISSEPITATLEVCISTSENISSMLQDVRKKRPTEIEAINGAIVGEGRHYGIPTPVNEQLVRKVREIESNYSL